MAVTIRDVARAAGVSISTVSRALATPEQVAVATRERVQAIAKEMGYSPDRSARGLITGRRGNIGLVVPDLENPFFGSISKGVQERARAAGYGVFIADTDEDPMLEAEIVLGLSKQVDGIVLCSPRATDGEIERFADQTPIVLANRRIPGIASIIFDNRDGMRAALGHLAALGHTRIAYAGGPTRSWTNGQRAEAFFRYENESIELIELGNFSPNFAGGVQAADHAIASGATGVVAYNDIMALGVIDRLRQRGVDVPREMSVVGFDNVSISTLVWPNLTTVNVPRLLMGRASVDALVANVSGAASADAELLELPVDLVVRQSTGVVRSSARTA